MAAPPSGVNLALLDKLVAALSAKGLVTEAEIAERQAITDRASPEIGARMVARAWTDPDYYALLMKDGKAAAEAAGAVFDFADAETAVAIGGADDADAPPRDH